MKGITPELPNGIACDGCYQSDIDGVEVRKIPYGTSGGNFHVCKRCYVLEQRFRAAAGVPTPLWTALTIVS